MSHLAGYCRCGRKIHFPKNSPLGTKWTCWKCGQTYYLSNNGEPLHSEQSKMPLESSNDENLFNIIFEIIGIIGNIFIKVLDFIIKFSFEVVSGFFSK